MEEDTASKIQRLKDWNGILIFIVVVLALVSLFHAHEPSVTKSELDREISKAKQEQMNELFGTETGLQSAMECAMWGLWWRNKLNASLKPWFEAVYDTSILENLCTEDVPEFTG